MIMKRQRDPRTMAEVAAAQRTCERLRHFVDDPDDADALADAAAILADLAWDMEANGQRTMPPRVRLQAGRCVLSRQAAGR